MLTPNDETAYRPCMIVAHADTDYAARTARAFRRLGWDVYRASAGPEVRRLAWMLDPALVVLDAELPGESGWLTCDKLTREQPLIKVVLVDAGTAAGRGRFAEFVGAAGLVGRDDGVEALLDEVCETALPVAG